MKYALGHTVKGLLILQHLHEGNANTEQYWVRHILDCGVEYQISRGGIDKERRNPEFCRACMPKKVLRRAKTGLNREKGLHHDQYMDLRDAESARQLESFRPNPQKYNPVAGNVFRTTKALGA